MTLPIIIFILSVSSFILLSRVGVKQVFLIITDVTTCTRSTDAQYQKKLPVCLFWPKIFGFRWTERPQSVAPFLGNYIKDVTLLRGSPSQERCVICKSEVLLSSQQVLCSKSHDFLVVLALAHSKINRIIFLIK